ncbi:hypothetical protein FOA52_012634 [Chlamydomonas sp. UWO 241]|nr:hypothetical protein FOA52_012634 [Chlamydomonas sp. UWO 241]
MVIDDNGDSVASRVSAPLASSPGDADVSIAIASDSVTPEKEQAGGSSSHDGGRGPDIPVDVRQPLAGAFDAPGPQPVRSLGIKGPKQQQQQQQEVCGSRPHDHGQLQTDTAAMPAVRAPATPLAAGPLSAAAAAAAAYPPDAPGLTSCVAELRSCILKYNSGFDGDGVRVPTELEGSPMLYRRVYVLRPDDEAWYMGTVIGRWRAGGVWSYYVAYDDGKTKVLQLDSEVWTIADDDGAALLPSRQAFIAAFTEFCDIEGFEYMRWYWKMLELDEFEKWVRSQQQPQQQQQSGSVRAGATGAAAMPHAATAGAAAAGAGTAVTATVTPIRQAPLGPKAAAAGVAAAAVHGPSRGVDNCHHCDGPGTGTPKLKLKLNRLAPADAAAVGGDAEGHGRPTQVARVQGQEQQQQQQQLQEVCGSRPGDHGQLQTDTAAMPAVRAPATPLATGPLSAAATAAAAYPPDAPGLTSCVAELRSCIMRHNAGFGGDGMCVPTELEGPLMLYHRVCAMASRRGLWSYTVVYDDGIIEVLQLDSEVWTIADDDGVALLPSRQAFTAAYTEFCSSCGFKYRVDNTQHGTFYNVFALWLSIQYRGGFVQVSAEKKWNGTVRSIVPPEALAAYRDKLHLSEFEEWVRNQQQQQQAQQQQAQEQAPAGASLPPTTGDIRGGRNEHAKCTPRAGATNLAAAAGTAVTQPQRSSRLLAADAGSLVSDSAEDADAVALLLALQHVQPSAAAAGAPARRPKRPAAAAAAAASDADGSGGEEGRGLHAKVARTQHGRGGGTPTSGDEPGAPVGAAAALSRASPPGPAAAAEQQQQQQEEQQEEPTALPPGVPAVTISRAIKLIGDLGADRAKAIAEIAAGATAVRQVQEQVAEQRVLWNDAEKEKRCASAKLREASVFAAKLAASEAEEKEQAEGCLEAAAEQWSKTATWITAAIKKAAAMRDAAIVVANAAIATATEALVELDRKLQDAMARGSEAVEWKQRVEDLLTQMQAAVSSALVVGG